MYFSPYLMSLRNKIFICRSDITKIAVDAIVNAANSSLLGGGGVDGAIHRAAGRKLLEECKEIGGCNTGDAKITHSYNISQIKAIIHTVGPNIHSKVTERDEKLLTNCYWNSLQLAKKNKLSSIAFPCISTGIYSYPNDSAANVAMRTVKRWLETNDNASKMRAIVFVIFTEVDYKIYRKTLPKVFPSSLDEQADGNSFNFERSFNDDESPDNVQTKENKPKEGDEKKSVDESIKMEVAESQSAEPEVAKETVNSKLESNDVPTKDKSKF
uniref:Macro domain-containing protein n=1 Tax=Acrobeloides nanus TaxID=290746 RepID=A0A914DCN9_9BILA